MLHLSSAYRFYLKLKNKRLSCYYYQCYQYIYRGCPKKMSLFFFGNNFYKSEETFKIFSPQILEVYRTLLVQTILESIMFYYTFLVINDMFDPGTTLLYDSSNSNIKLSTTLLSISCGIRLISVLMLSLRTSVVCGLFS